MGPAKQAGPDDSLAPLASFPASSSNPPLQRLPATSRRSPPTSSPPRSRSSRHATAATDLLLLSSNDKDDARGGLLLIDPPAAADGTSLDAAVVLAVVSCVLRVVVCRVYLGLDYFLGSRCCASSPCRNCGGGDTWPRLQPLKISSVCLVQCHGCITFSSGGGAAAGLAVSCAVGLSAALLPRFDYLLGSLRGATAVISSSLGYNSSPMHEG